MVTDQQRELELRALGMAWRDGRVLAHYAARLRTEHFALPAHRSIWAAMVQCYAQEGVLSLTTLNKLLRQQQPPVSLKDCEAAVGAYALPGDVEAVAKELELAALRRRLAQAGMDIARLSSRTDLDAEKLAEEAHSHLWRALSDHRSAVDEVHDLSDAVAAYVQKLRDLAEGRRKTGLTVSLPATLDRWTGGFKPGELIVVAGRSNMGKSALAFSWSLQIAKRSGPVLYFSLEMSEEALAQRVVQSDGGLDSESLNNPGPDVLARAERVMAECQRWRVRICDTPGLTVDRIRLIAKAEQLRLGNLQAVVVDHLGELRLPESRNNQASVVGDAVRELRHLAREMGLPLILVSQLNRGVENRNNPRPKMSDLRDSGRIEEIADLVLLLYRHEKYHKVPDALRGVTELIIGKGRSTRTGTVLLQFQPEIVRFSEAPPEKVRHYVDAVLKEAETA